MPKDKHGLGRGLDALIPTTIESEFDPTQQNERAGDQLLQIAPPNISPNPHQPRQNFDEAELKNLATSLKEHGVIQPLVVMSAGAGKYQLIAGERRLRAAKIAGLATVPVIVRSMAEQQQLEVALIENLQRQDLNAIETATAYRKLADQFNLGTSEIAARAGKDQSTVINTMRLLALPLEVKRAVASGQITEGHGRAILMVPGEAKQLELLGLVLKNQWTVRQTENFARNYKSTSTSTEKAMARSAGSNEYTRDLAKLLGAKVNVVPMAKGGKLVIEYQSDQELERIYKQIKG